MKKLAAILSTAAVLVASPAAFADPDFGPGNSSKGPNDGGAKCQQHDHGTGAGINEPEPGCKG
jgi:hypothetical protein